MDFTIKLASTYMSERNQQTYAMLSYQQMLRVAWKFLDAKILITTYTGTTMTHSADYSIKPEVTTNTQRMHLKLLQNSFATLVIQLKIWALK